MEVCYQLPVLPLDRPVPKHVLSRRGAISFSSSSSLFGAPDPRQLSQMKTFPLVNRGRKSRVEDTTESQKNMSLWSWNAYDWV
ncbi:high affinity cAMP-specific 3',5'-cyclic phosphodiesterase 7A isoform X1 [Lates japonicus]